MHVATPDYQCSLPLSFCCERVKGCCISDTCGGDATIHHVAEQTQGWLPLPCSSTTADGGVVTDDVWGPIADFQLLEKMQSQLPQSTNFASGMLLKIFKASSCQICQGRRLNKTPGFRTHWPMKQLSDDKFTMWINCDFEINLPVATASPSGMR